MHTLDPDCPDVSKFRDTLYGDPMTDAMGAPTGDIEEGFARRHLPKCKRCREFNVANAGSDK